MTEQHVDRDYESSEKPTLKYSHMQILCKTIHTRGDVSQPCTATAADSRERPWLGVDTLGLDRLSVDGLQRHTGGRKRLAKV